MLRKIMLSGMCAIALAGCRTTDAEPDSNPGSHHWELFSKVLLPERVLVEFNHGDMDRRNWYVSGAQYFTWDGRVIGCFGDPKFPRYRSVSAAVGDTLMGHDDDGMARWFIDDLSAGYKSVFFDPRSGRFHTEYWNGATWAFHDEGWVQESWPRSMVEACPDLPLPDDLPINEAQTSRRMWHMMLQDPDAVIRNETMGWDWPQGNVGKAERLMLRPYSWWRTYERRKLDPLPLGPPEGEEAAESPDPAAEERQAAQEFITLLKANTGRIFEDSLGRRYVATINAEGDEVWALDEHDDVVDVGLLHFAEGRRYVDLQWENLPDARNFRHRLGDPLPVTLQDEHHPLFEMMAWVVAQDRDIGLPYFGQPNVGFRLRPDGTLTARHMLGDIPGKWRFSRGRVVIEVEGVDDRAGYRWRHLARHLGWPLEDA